MKHCKLKKTCAGCQWVKCAWCANWKPQTVEVYPTNSGRWFTLATGECAAFGDRHTRALFMATDGAGCQRFAPRDCGEVRR